MYIVYRVVPPHSVLHLYHFRQIARHTFDAQYIVEEIRHKVPHVWKAEMIMVCARFPRNIDTAAFSKFIHCKCWITGDISGVSVFRRRMPMGRNKPHALFYTRLILCIAINIMQIDPVSICDPRKLFFAFAYFKICGNVVTSNITRFFFTPRHRKPMS